ncbi:MAG: type III pantothenate kinase [Betaproteobacteria bacterium]|nr:type III pantothenate kinase [Betaproteobacteria bacterium]
MNGTVLAIDAGNTRIKWGAHDGTHWLRQAWLDTRRAAELEPALAGLPPLEAVVVSNVAGAALREVILRALPPTPPPRWITSERAQCGVRNSYDDPAQLGCDRWAALIGARRLHGGPAIVVDAGTALTADALTGDGVFVGGIIVPGADLMRKALAEHTAALKLQPGKFSFFPNTTGDAIVSGAIDALAGAIERMARFLEEAGQPQPACVLSGGGAALLEPYLNLEVKVVDNLVLEGLLAIAREGQSGE